MKTIILHFFLVVIGVVGGWAMAGADDVVDWAREEKNVVLVFYRGHW